jgi:hypothetical protein
MTQHETEPMQDYPPIPVYIVQDLANRKSVRSASPNNFPLPAAGGLPVLVCPRDSRRAYVYLLNESGSSNIRFARLPGQLTNGGGALLPWPLSSYLRLSTQDELWAVGADTGTPTISVIQEYDRDEE